MNRKQLTGSLESIWPAVLGALLALGLLLPLLAALDAGGTAVAVWACALGAVCCAIMGQGGVLRWIGAVAMGAAFLVLGIATRTLGNMGGMLGAAVHLVRGNIAPLRMYGPELALLAGMLLTLAGWYMARQGAGFYPALSLLMIVLLLLWFSDQRDAIVLLAPALVALCAMFARSASEETPTGRILAVSAAAVGVMLLVTPVLQPRSPRIERFADDLRNYITDTLFFTEPRTVYSIQVDGYKPLQSRLGGPIELNDRPVMTVKTPTSLLLRGVIYNEYTGLNWTNSLSSRRYLYGDPRNRGIRADTLDETRPTEAVRAETDLFRLASVSITMQSDSASTLFVPQRTESLSMPTSMVPYFNQSGELFITHSLAAGDAYSFSAPVINASDPRLPDLLGRAALSGGEARDMSAYLTLHDFIAEDVYTLTAQVTAAAGSPYEHARAIQNYLRSTYPYTLRPVVPPENQDFVSYFLLTGREGYCTYFATAMAVMGRIAGLPTRYVEGYQVNPVEGTALVTSKDAHAWCEVYFDGFGWVAFDATPPAGGSGRYAASDTGPEMEVAPWYEEPGDLGDDGQEAEPTPAPPDDGGGDDGQGEEQDDPSDPDDGPLGDDDPEPTPTPTPTPPPLPTPTPPGQTPDPNLPQRPDAPNDPDGSPPSLWWLWLLLVLALAALIVWRGLSTQPAQVAAREEDDKTRLMAWYRAVLGLLACAGMPARTSETPLAYAARVEKGIPKEAGLSQLAQAVTRAGYTREEVTQADEAQAARCYRAIWRAVPPQARLKWVARRMARGVGDTRQVP